MRCCPFLGAAYGLYHWQQHHASIDDWGKVNVRLENTISRENHLSDDKFIAWRG